MPHSSCSRRRNGALPADPAVPSPVRIKAKVDKRGSQELTPRSALRPIRCPILVKGMALQPRRIFTVENSGETVLAFVRFPPTLFLSPLPMLAWKRKGWGLFFSSPGAIALGIEPTAPFVLSVGLEAATLDSSGIAELRLNGGES
jgi:hypothetical protein